MSWNRKSLSTCERKGIKSLQITREVIRMKALELKRRFVQTGSMGDAASKASVDWCVQMMKRAGLTLWCQTILGQHLLTEFAEKLQRDVINL